LDNLMYNQSDEPNRLNTIKEFKQRTDRWEALRSKIQNVKNPAFATFVAIPFIGFPTYLSGKIIEESNSRESKSFILDRVLSYTLAISIPAASAAVVYMVIAPWLN